MTDEACREAVTCPCCGSAKVQAYPNPKAEGRTHYCYECRCGWNESRRAAWTARAGRGDVKGGRYFSVGKVDDGSDVVRGVYIEDSDFTYDVRLYVNGDFGSLEQRLAYAREIANVLNAHRSPSEREALDVDAVSARIARAIFACGDEPHSKTWRIQFMGGNQWHERGNGGLNEEALARLIARALMVRP